MGLYPTPLVVVGTMVEGRPNWVLVGHNGIMSFDEISINLNRIHYTNQGIHNSKALSVNMVDEKMLKKADYVGVFSGHDTDKSEIFEYSTGNTGAPIIDESPVSMDCRLKAVYENEKYENFICTVEDTYVEDSILDEHGHIDYRKFKPVLFESSTWEYMIAGDVIGKCRRIHDIE